MIQAIEAIRREKVVPVSKRTGVRGLHGRDDELVAVRASHRQRADRGDHHRAARGRTLVHPPYGRQRDVDRVRTRVGAARPVVVTWQIGADWKYDPSLVTTVELRFVAEGENRTRVELEHRELENFGPDAEKMSATFNEPGAWTATLARSRRAPATRVKYVPLRVGADDVLEQGAGRTSRPTRRACDDFHARGEHPAWSGPSATRRSRARWRSSRPAAAEAFVDGDPFVLNGVVAAGRSGVERGADAVIGRLGCARSLRSTAEIPRGRQVSTWPVRWDGCESRFPVAS